MAKHPKKDHNNRDTTDSGRRITNPPRDICLKIPQPFAILQQSTPQDDTRYAEECQSRRDQITAARRLNHITIAGAVVSIIGLSLVYLSFRVSRTAAVAAQQQSVTASKELEVSQRPWMKVEILVHNPIFFDDAGIHANITVRGIDVGHSPAVGAFVNYKFVVRSGIVNLLDEQKAICRDNPDPFGMGDVVFPNDSLETTQPRMITADALSSTLQGQPGFMEPTIIANGHVVADQAFQPYIIGCLQYETDYSRVVHQTMFLYESDDLLINPGMHGSYTATFTKPFGFGNTAS